MTYIQSSDGTTIEREVSGLPTRFVRRLDTQEWSIPEPATAEDFGFYALTEVAQPDSDHVRSITNTGPGAFTETWTFDQVRADENAANVVRQTKSMNVRQAVATLRDWADDARNTNVTSGNHQAVTQTVVDRLGTFFDRFADLIESQGP